MKSKEPFKWQHVQSEIILLNVHWYCRYPLSYRSIEEMMLKRGVKVDLSTTNQWVLAFGPEIDKRCRPFLTPTNDTWRVDETYLKIKKEWTYPHRVVDSEGNTLDFMLSAKRVV